MYAVIVMHIRTTPTIEADNNWKHRFAKIIDFNLL